jgi:hypothetical protein
MSAAREMGGSVWHHEMPFASTQDAIRHEAERQEAQASRIRGRELPVPSLTKPYSEEEIDEIRAGLGVTGETKDERLLQLDDLLRDRHAPKHVIHALMMRELMGR